VDHHDLGKFGIHTNPETPHPGAARAEGRRQTLPRFEVLNLGRYERQVYLNVAAGSLGGKRKEQALAQRNRSSGI